jgi:hypothetical protein
MRVQVYYNLHKHCWSIRDVKTRRVIDHLNSLVLRECRCVVSEKGRQRVLSTRHKNVHAYIEGVLESEDIVGEYQPLRYNPYLMKKFMSGVREIDYCRYVIFTDVRLVYMIE